MTATRLTLRPTELEVVTLAAQGLDYATIGTRIGRAPKSVKDRLGRSYRRVGARGCEHLVAMACRAGLLDDVPAPAPPPGMSERLLEVLPLLAAGLTNQEIAARLWISLEGVQTRVKALYRAMGATGRAHAVFLAWQWGLLPEEGDR